MVLTVKVLGILIIALAVILVAYPDAMKKMLNACMNATCIYAAAIVRLIIGAFLLVAAAECHHVWLMIVLGVLLLATGVLAFLLGVERVKKVIGTILEKQPIVHRLIAIVPLIVGVLLVYGA